MVNTDEKKSLIIKNDYIGREYKIERKRLSTVCISNFLTGRDIIPGDNSEEFSVCFAGFPKRIISASELKVEQIKAYEADGISSAVIEFRRIKVKGCNLGLSLTVSLADGDAFIRKTLSVFSEDDASGLRLDSISMDIITVDPLVKCSQLPSQESCAISGFQLSLGQPVFVDTLYLGCEFPVSLNTVLDNCTELKYYSGKPLSELLTDGVYNSYPAVCGSARAGDEKSLTDSFLRYIEKISLPCSFRCQYNSWYDNMTDINPDNLTASFYEIEKGCTSFGLPPLDAYVADDGWNDYSADFWTFNSKFPDGMFPVAGAARLLGSSFGLWLGPRGGYNVHTLSFAKKIEAAGNGHVNRRSHDICVASSTYTEKVGKLLSDYVEKYDLTYLKLDGFSKKACKDSGHGHLTGGKDNIYYYTDLCEKWLQIFNRIRTARKASSGKDIHINATCYVNPSPWLLKWVNTVWIQNSDDCGVIDTADDGTKLAGSDKDKLLTYRDNCYYDFYKVRKFKFPPNRIYNHEPVYGKTAKISMSGTDFLQYLLINACRGVSFWELYYSSEMMDDEKWAYNAAVLTWARKYAPILSRSEMIGNVPSSGFIYGYSCFNNEDGIIALRNPSQKAASYTLHFDESMGISTSIKEIPCCDAVSSAFYGDISYGGNMEIKLQPHETKVFVFGTVKPLEIPSKPKMATRLPENGAFKGTEPFTVRCFISPDSDVLFSQGDEVVIKVSDTGKINFSVGNLSVESTTNTSCCTQATGVREPNGMLKLYIDGVLEASAYSPETYFLCGDSAPVKNGNVSLFDGAMPFDTILS